MIKKEKMTKQRFIHFYRKLSMVRQFEEKVDELFRQGKIAGTVHTSVGQEAVAVGAGEALEEKDLVVATHRGHGHCLMRGAGLKPMMAELLGKGTGLCKGKGGSMHIVDVRRGMLGAMGIVGAGLPISVGVGWAIKRQKTGQVCACFFGDNASNGGPFHEALNVSALWKLPIVFICENNLYGLSVSVNKTSAVQDIAVRATGYGIPGVIADGMDVFAVHDVVKKAVDRARGGAGPSLVECKTYRFLGHSRGDPSYGPYRTKEEWESWKKRDPLILLRKRGNLTPEEVGKIEQEVSAELSEAVLFAEQSPNPEIGDVLDDIFA